MKKVFPILAISTFSSMLGVGIIAPLLPLYSDSLGASGLWIGVIFAAFSISRSLFMPFVGRISDRKGRRRFIVAGLLLYAAISLGYVWAGQISELTLIRVLHGVASAMIIPIAQAYIGELSPEGEEGKWMGYFNACFFTGFAFGPLLGGLLTDYLSMEAAFYTMGALNLVAFLVALLLLPEVLPEKVRSLSPRPSLLSMRESDLMKGLVSYRLVYAVGRGSYMAFLPIFAASTLDLTAGEIGVVIAVHMLIVSLSQTLSGRIADVFDRKAMVVVGSLISLGFLALIPTTHSLWQLLGLSMFGALGGTLALPAASALTVEEGRKYGMGSALGIFNMAMSIGMSVGPIIGGAVDDAWGVNAVFYVGAGIGVVGTALFVRFTA
jgi:DHA1 family multidrug resistance protein-like MFS transporter